MRLKKSKATKLLSLLFVVLMLVGLLSLGSISVGAEANEYVKAAANGVFVVKANMVLSGNLRVGERVVNYDKKKFNFGTGTAFLVNETTLLTCYHVIDLEAIKEEARTLGLTCDDVKYEIVVTKDVTVPCTIKNGSEQDDYAILTLNDKIGGRDVLTLADSSQVTPTQTVYALGFPGAISLTESLIDSENIPYDKDDVTITEGVVQKTKNLNNTDVIQHGCDIMPGNSGGPLVDELGRVVGINKWYRTTGQAYNYSTSINEARNVLDSLNIDYRFDGTPAGPGTQSNTVDATEEQTMATTTVAPVASTVAPPSSPSPSGNIDVNNGRNTTTDENGMVKMIIIIAIAVVVVAIIAVVIAIILSSRKKASKNSGPNGTRPPAPPVNPMTPPVPGGGYSSVPPAFSNEGAGETSVLNDGAGETTVLGSQSFTMLRKRNNERISINKSEFAIGKERRRVDYCISDNNSVSRVHAKIRVRNGRCYIVDLGSTNCTYVNGNKLGVNQEVVLSPGDTIKISDEEFNFIG